MGVGDLCGLCSDEPIWQSFVLSLIYWKNVEGGVAENPNRKETTYTPPLATPYHKLAQCLRKADSMAVFCTLADMLGKVGQSQPHEWQLKEGTAAQGVPLDKYYRHFSNSS